MKKKLSVVDRVLRSSDDKDKIIEKAFNDLSASNIKTFASTTQQKFPFIGKSAIANRSLSDCKTYLPDYLKKAENNKVVNYAEGLLLSNLNNIKKFIKLEEKFFNHLLFKNKIESLNVINEIELEFGESYWSISQKYNIQALNSEECTIPIDKYNSIDNVFLKMHVNNIVDIDSGYVIEHKDIDAEYKKDSVFSLFNYRVYGFDSSSTTFDVFDVIRYEMSSTLIDLYKAFELFCYLSILKYDLIFEPYTNSSIEFVRKIEHYLLINASSLRHDSNNIILYDKYTDGKYEFVINEMVKNKEFDISKFKILAKSLSYSNNRLEENNLFDKLANLMANVYEKDINFSQSVSVLSNINLAFRGILPLLIVKHILKVETKGFYNEKEGYVNRAESIFSKDWTPLKIKYLNNISASEKLIEDYGSTNRLFNMLTSNQFSPISERHIKYKVIELVNNGDFSGASSLLDDIQTIQDKELSQLYIRIKARDDKLNLACEQFLINFERYPSAINYFITKDFYDKLEKSAKSSININIPICLYICKDSFVDKKMNQCATGVSIGKTIRSFGIKNPSEITFEDKDWKSVYFLSDVCSKEMLTKSLLYRSQTDAYDERIKICNVLVSNKLGNLDKLINESKALSKRKVLEVAEKQVNSSKIYADKDYILNNSWDILSSWYKDFLNQNNEMNVFLDNQIEDALTKVDLSDKKNTTVSSLGLKIVPSHILQYASLGKDYRSKAVFQMLKNYIEEYCFGVKGLNTYLSTRIRHGTLYSTVTSNLVSNGFLPTDDSDNDSVFCNLVKGLDEWIINKIKSKRLAFKSELNVIFNEIVNVWIQITYENNEKQGRKFDFSISLDELQKVTSRIEDAQSFLECCSILDDYVEDKLLKSCEEISNLLEFDTKKRLEILFDNFENDVFLLEKDMGVKIPYEFSRLITSSKQHTFNQLDVIIGWFTLRQDFHEESYDLEVVVGIIENMVQIDNLSLDDKANIKISYHVLSSVVDVFFNLVNNAIKYSKLHLSEVDIKIESYVNKNNGFLVFEVINTCHVEEDFLSHNEDLKRYSKNLTAEQLKDLIQKEGNTGIAKIKSAIRYELETREYVNLNYLSQDKFSASVSFRNAKGITYNENSFD
ncbi:hypothetical protein KGP23_07265 [Serratia ureilytica]|uniref:hypothetical protein n=1 Tax=Serratia ureilytica TaxID=300181 RepID=UPI001CBC92E7|nr:hypothetical protein [Serratia ureilytica]UAN28627.1 hypothetical protein KGP23_07265 [Serratia ureilytica]